MKNIRLKAVLGVFVLFAMAGCDSQPQGASTTQSVAQQSRTHAAGSDKNLTQQTAKKTKPSWPFIKDDSEAAVGFDKMLQQNFYVVFDGSGSMAMAGCDGSFNNNVRKMDVAKKALISFSEIVPGDANLGLLAFDDRGVEELVKLGEGTRQGFVEKVSSVRAGGMTPLKTSIKRAYTRLTERARSQLGYGEYHLVVVTDGEASDGENPKGTINQILGESPVVIHTVGFCIDSMHSLNQPGRILYRSANDYESLKKGLTSVLAEAPDFSVSDFQ